MEHGLYLSKDCIDDTLHVLYLLLYSVFPSLGAASDLPQLEDTHAQYVPL